MASQNGNKPGASGTVGAERNSWSYKVSQLIAPGGPASGSVDSQPRERVSANYSRDLKASDRNSAIGA